MLSLRYISLFAMACATLSSAAPGIVGARQTTTEPFDPNQPSGSNPGQTSGSTSTQQYGPDNASRRSNIRSTLQELEVVTNAVDNSDHAVPAPRDQPTNSLPQVISVATSTIQPIVTQLKADIVTKIDVNVIAQHLNQIVTALEVAIADVNLVVQGPDCYSYQGTVLTVRQIARLVYGLLDIIFGVLYAIVQVVSITDVTVGPIIVLIGARIVELLTAILGLVGDLKVVLAVTLQPLITPATHLNYSQILAVVGIKA